MSLGAGLDAANEMATDVSDIDLVSVEGLTSSNHGGRTGAGAFKKKKKTACWGLWCCASRIAAMLTRINSQVVALVRGGQFSQGGRDSAMRRAGCSGGREGPFESRSLWCRLIVWPHGTSVRGSSAERAAVRDSP